MNLTYRDVEDETWVEEQVSLKWGESRVFQYPNGWKVSFDSFDGKHQEFPGGYLPYLDVHVTGNGQFNIKAKDPSALEII